MVKRGWKYDIIILSVVATVRSTPKLDFELAGIALYFGHKYVGKVLLRYSILSDEKFTSNLYEIHGDNTKL